MRGLFYILIVWSQLLLGQAAWPWNFDVGGDMHRFRINFNNTTINGQPFAPSNSDAIGVFEVINGNYECRGFEKAFSIFNDTLSLVASTDTGTTFQANSKWVLVYWDSTSLCTRIINETVSDKQLINGSFTNLENLTMSDWTFHYTDSSVLSTSPDLLPIKSDSNTTYRIYSSSSSLKLDSVSGRIFVSQSQPGNYQLALVTTACLTVPKNLTFKINAVADTTINLDTVPIRIVNQICKNLGSLEIMNIPNGFLIDLLRISSNDTITILNNKFDSLSAGSYQLRFYNLIKQTYSTKFVVVEDDCKNPILSFIKNENPPPIFIPDIGTCKIFNREGRLVQQSQAPFEWNGTAQDNTILPTGDYVVFLNDKKYQTITIVR